MKFEKHDLDEGMKLPAATLRRCGFDLRQAAECHMLKDAIAFFVKVGSAYFDYRRHGQFEWTAPAILLACLIFTLTAPTYIWSILGQ